MLQSKLVARLTMNFLKNRRLLITSAFLLLFLVASSQTTYALFEDVVEEVKEIFTGKEKKFTVDSEIELVAEGDVEKNGQIDAGDIVRFTYTILNTTDKDYSFATLKTNIDRKQLNFIHNIYGATSLNDDGKTIEIPNFRIGANQTATIIFDARINYFSDQDPTLITEAEFVSEDLQTVAKSSKKEIKVNRIQKEKIPGMMKQEIKNEIIEL